MLSRDTVNNPEALSACPACDYLRDSPTSDCAACGFDPNAIEADDDRDLGVRDPSPIGRMIGASIGIGLMALVLLMGIAGVWGNPDQINRGIVRLITIVLS
jgi:hypothetical protein